MANYPGVYCIRFGLNERIYIGSALRCSTRKGQHLYKLRRNSHCNPKLQNYFNKYGEELFSFHILEHLPTSSFKEVRMKEQEYLNKYFAQEYIESGFKDKRFDQLLLNVSPEVDLMRVHWTEERREAQRERNRSFKWTPEMREKMSRTKTGQKLSIEDEAKRLASCNTYHENKAMSRSLACPICGHYRVKKLGKRLNKTLDIMMQRVKCIKCGKCSSIELKNGPSGSDS